MYQKALKIAYKAHHNQTREDSCVPYIVHPLRVASNFNDDTRKSIAILHDVLEDTDVELKDLWEMSKRVSETVCVLTRTRFESYWEYIERIAKDEIATEIKIADIVDNLSDTLSPPKKSRVQRYNRALAMLIVK